MRQLDPVYVDITQSSQDLLRLRAQFTNGELRSAAEEAPVRLKLENGAMYPHEGRLQFTDVSVDESTGMVSLRALFPNPERELLSGSIGNIVLRNPQTDAITIPMTATVELQDKIIAYRLKNGRAEAAYLTVDRLNDGNRFIVKEGLSVGDTLIAEGVGLVREGMSITPKDETK